MGNSHCLLSSLPSSAEESCDVQGPALRVRVTGLMPDLDAEHSKRYGGSPTVALPVFGRSQQDVFVLDLDCSRQGSQDEAWWCPHCHCPVTQHFDVGRGVTTHACPSCHRWEELPVEVFPDHVDGEDDDFRDPYRGSYHDYRGASDLFHAQQYQYHTPHDDLEHNHSGDSCYDDMGYDYDADAGAGSKQAEYDRYSTPSTAPGSFASWDEMEGGLGSGRHCPTTEAHPCYGRRDGDCHQHQQHHVHSSYHCAVPGDNEDYPERQFHDGFQSGDEGLLHGDSSPASVCPAALGAISKIQLQLQGLDEAALKSKLRRLQLQWHPDKAAGDPAVVHDVFCFVQAEWDRSFGWTSPGC